MSTADAEDLPPAASPMQRFTVSGSNFEIDGKYQPIKQIGTGAYGVVIAANDTETGEHLPHPTLCHDLLQAVRWRSKRYTERLKTWLMRRYSTILMRCSHPSIAENPS